MINFPIAPFDLELGMVFSTLDFPLVTHGGTYSSTTWPTANKAFYVPIVCRTPVTINRLRTMNGSAVSGNLDMGLYDAAGNRLVSSGSTGQSGTNAIQEISITATYLTPPGLFYIAIAFDNTTATYQRLVFNAIADQTACGGYEQTTAFPLPSTATFATLTTSSFPVVAGVNAAMP